MFSCAKKETDMKKYLTFIILAIASFFATMCTIAISTWLSIGLVTSFALCLSCAICFSNVLNKIAKKRNKINEKKQKIYFNQIVYHLRNNEMDEAKEKYNNFLKNRELRLFAHGMLIGLLIEDNEKVNEIKLKIL